jgi:hypothetical protein
MDKIYQLKDQFLGKKIAIDDVVTTYSSKLGSHKSSWAYLLKNQLEYIGLEVDVLDKSSDLQGYDVWFVALPMEFQGSYNLFGGAGDEPAARIQRLLDFDGEIWVLNREMPDVGAFVKSRINSCSEKWAALNAERITERCKSINTLSTSLDTGTFILGDSHSVSVYQRGADISRNDGKTLFGVLREGMQGYIPEGTTHLVTYFGNIDVRHHICRRENPIEVVTKLVQDYILHLQKLEIPNITIHTLLPIEFEGRRIPKTGWYKGNPFSGSREDRERVMLLFNERLRELGVAAGFRVLDWPEHWYSTSPEKWAEMYMEKPGSVHLSREYYYWDWSTEKINPNLNKKTISLF